ncbi:MAG TPA: hypothetical protein VFW29_03185 [Solirubrobacteraceae bacterium]|nr:hypothetical protein [Solirubrobacteraceae bacterium]
MRIRRFGIAGAVLAVTIAVAALASSASASPVFFGKAAVGSTVAPVKFTGTLGAAFLEAKAGTKITCTAGTSTGEVTGPTTGKNGVTKFTGCETSGVECHNAAANEIDTKVLAGTLGNVSATLPGIRLFDEKEGRGGILAEFTCAGGAVKVQVRGSVIGSLSGASGKTVEEGKLATSSKLTFAEKEGIQKYVKFVPGEGEAGEEQLEGNTGAGFEKSGQSVIATLKTTPAGQLGVTK